MKKQLIKEIILAQHQNIIPKDLGIERQELFKIYKYTLLPYTIIISTIRRVGKSTLLAKIIRATQELQEQEKSYASTTD